MIKIGCCGLSVSWEKYIKEFKLVEIQKTFYQPPDDITLKRWRERVPPEFEFTVKAWQLITHPSSSPTYRKLKDKANIQEAGFFRDSSAVKYGYQRTVECAKTLGAKIILYQTPASFKPDKENIRNLKYFFTTIAREKFIHIWEPRGKWNREEIKKIASECKIFIAVDPFKIKPFSQKIVYFRLHGIGGYRYRYSDGELKELAGMIKKLKFQFCYVLFNNVYMWESALKFKEML
jgi:uncharacterized protein YecE (DUF72 family)